MLIDKSARAVSRRSVLDIVVTSTASDAHTWNLVYLQLVLEELGHRVTNLGATVPVGMLTEHCRTQLPDLVVVSTVNGHGVLDGKELISALRAVPELHDIRVVIGGKLSVDGSGGLAHVGSLHEAGFDAVFLEDGQTPSFPTYVKALSEKAEQ
jgi:methylaspartate mutase sigma subunit